MALFLYSVSKIEIYTAKPIALDSHFVVGGMGGAAIGSSFRVEWSMAIG